LRKYNTIENLSLGMFKHIVAGAFFQLQKSCILRVREINTLVSGDVLFIDVNPDNIHQQLLLSAIEREQVMKQLGVSHLLSISEKNWAGILQGIRKIQNCENSIYKGPFFISGLSETGADYSQTSNFLIRSFQDHQNFTWHNDLGYYFPLNGTVVYGNQIGRTLGYPTLNIQPNEIRKLIPPMGVYTGMAKIRGQWYKTMINIGIRPTLDLSKVTIEAHIFDYSDEIYGETVALHFMGRIRDEMRFASLDTLKEQLKIDQKMALSFLDDLHIQPSQLDDILIADTKV
jgi:hypothetical protein